MAAWYGYGNKASVDEDEMKGQPAITMKTQGVNEVVRPTTTAARYVVGGGGYKGRNNLRDTLDKLGKVKDFLDQDDTEMIVPTNLSRPGPNRATRPSWPKLAYFGQMKMKKEDDEKGIPGFNNQEGFTPADKAEDSSKKPDNFWEDEDDREVESIAPNNRGSNPYPNDIVMKPTNYRGTAAMDAPCRDDRQSYGVNNNSSDEDNSNKVKESEEMPNFPNRNGQHNNSESNPYEDYKTKHEKPNMSNGGDIKNSKKSVTQDSAASMHRTGDLPNTNRQHKDDDDGQKKNNIAPRTYVKPNISSGWQDYYYNGSLKRNGNYSQGGYSYNRAQRWKEITPNPPPQLLQYGGGGSGGVYPYFQPVYPRAVIDSKRAEKKYNGLLLTEN